MDTDSDLKALREAALQSMMSKKTPNTTSSRPERTGREQPQHQPNSPYRGGRAHFVPNMHPSPQQPSHFDPRHFYHQHQPHHGHPPHLPPHPQRGLRFPPDPFYHHPRHIPPLMLPRSQLAFQPQRPHLIPQVGGGGSSGGLLRNPFPRLPLLERPFLPLPPLYQARPPLGHPGPRFPRFPNRGFKPAIAAQQQQQQLPPSQDSNRNVQQLAGNHDCEPGSTSRQGEEPSSQELRRLPGRFSRIDRSDSESEEDDRLDEYADDDVSDKDQDVKIVEDEGSDAHSPGSEEQAEEVEQEEESSKDDTAPEKEKEFDSILDEILGTTPSVDDDIDDLLGSGDEFDLYSDKKPEDSESGSRGRNQTSSRKISSLPKKSPEKEPRLNEPAVRLISQNETKDIPGKPAKLEIEAPVAAPLVKKIKLRQSLDEDPVERRKRKFGLTSPVKESQEQKTQIASSDGSDASSRKMRSFVVLKR